MQGLIILFVHVAPFAQGHVAASGAVLRLSNPVNYVGCGTLGAYSDSLETNHVGHLRDAPCQASA